MKKRDVLTASLVGAVAATIGLGKAAADIDSPKQDWRDELISKHEYFSFHTHREYEETQTEPSLFRTKSTLTLHIYKEEDKWVIGHFHNEYPADKIFPNDRIATNLEGAYTKFETLEEACKFASKLKERYYG